MDLGIAGRPALVSGGSSGLGYAVARALAGEGARVVIAARDADRLSAAVASLRKDTGGEVESVSLDVRDRDAGERFVQAAQAAFGPPEILVTNAGGPPAGPAAGFTVEDFASALELSVLGAVGLTQAALPAMKAGGWGRVVHLTSYTVHEPDVGLFLSSTVRPSIAGYAKALATEVGGSGITVNVVAPGYIGTERLNALATYRAKVSGNSEGAEREAMEQASPVGRVGDPDEVGSAVAFLASEPAAFINGMTLRVDGGMVRSLL